MPVDYQQLPTIPAGLVEALKQLHPVKLSERDDTDFDRGVAWGKQEMINYIAALYAKQRQK